MIITVPAANAIVPRAVGAVVGAAASNPYTAATVGVVVGGLALAKYVELATPEWRKFPGQMRSAKRIIKSKVHKWTAPKAAPMSDREAWELFQEQLREAARKAPPTSAPTPPHSDAVTAWVDAMDAYYGTDKPQ